MIVKIENVKEEKELENIPDEKLKRKMKAIEIAIRKYTNNKFLDTNFRFYGQVIENKIKAPSYPYIKEDDSIQLSHSLNNGVYTVKEIDGNNITLDQENLFDCDNVMITKVTYPEDVQEGVINLLKWDFGLRSKVGVKSETLSRHSVTYYDMDKDNTLKGYPISLLGFLEDYKKARF